MEASILYDIDFPSTNLLMQMCLSKSITKSSLPNTKFYKSYMIEFSPSCSLKYFSVSPISLNKNEHPLKSGMKYVAGAMSYFSSVNAPKYFPSTPSESPIKSKDLF